MAFSPQLTKFPKFDVSIRSGTAAIRSVVEYIESECKEVLRTLSDLSGWVTAASASVLLDVEGSFSCRPEQPYCQYLSVISNLIPRRARSHREGRRPISIESSPRVEYIAER